MDYTEIIDYLNKPTDPALKEKLNQWLQADSSHQLIFNKIERLWELSGKEMETPDPNITIAWNNVQSRIQPRTKLKLGLWLRVAAAILMIIAGSYWGYNLLFREAPNLVVITQEEGIKEVLLADGTKVFLNKVF